MKNAFWGRLALLGAGALWLFNTERFQSLVHTIAPQDEWLKEQTIAHRGLHLAGLPENSLAAFARAIEEGYAIELDVQLSRDGVPVVFHDDSLYRLTGVERQLKDLSLAELQQLRLLGTEQRIPSLQEVLDLVDGRVPLLVEIKNDDLPGDLEDKVIPLLRAYDGPYVVQSFNPWVVGYFARNAPEMTRGQLFARPRFPWDMGLHLLRDNIYNWISRPHFVNYQYSAIAEANLSEARSRGLVVLAWTLTIDMLADGQYKKWADNVIVDP